MRKLLALILPLVLLSACGGGGGSSSGGGGGGGGGGGQVIAKAGPPNVEPIVIDGGPAALTSAALNTAYVTVKVCVPGTSTCQSIDHVEIDTGSSGLRILGSVLTVSLPPASVNGAALAECLQFADGSSFGPVATADMELPTSGEKAAAINVQIIGQSSYSTLPSDCQTGPENTVPTFGANGILGVGPFMQDCGSACVSAVIPSTYYSCPTPATCTGTMVTLAQQVSNPVNSFGTDNNGVIVELPTVAASGASGVDGVIVFGIGTESNNALGSAVVMTTDDVGFIRAAYSGTTGLDATLDSGSNITYFTDSTIPTCTQAPELYCPNSTLSLTATLSGMNNVSTTADFTVANAFNVLNGNNSTAVPGLAGPLSLVNNPQGETIQFDLGMPFFFGKNVFTALESKDAGGTVGPYFAY